MGLLCLWFTLPLSAQPTAADSSMATQLVAFAETLLGTPYRHAGKTPKAFDCSGFVHYVFKCFGIAMPASSALYSKHLGREVKLSEARAGDIVVFTGTNSAIRRAGHVGIVTSSDGKNLRFIHASSSAKTNAVTYNFLADGSYRKRFLKVIRVLPP
ncbi:MAG: C40 family peptidase [Cytophagales bacterium]|nr:C40 family peptidase [Bernardetiaceae bacterium]MDW8204779.1 C40 family peptidase [Cytophagales bacterium]